MNICVVNTFFPPHVSGTARASFLLSRRISEAGHSVTVVTSSIEGPPKIEKSEDMVVHRLRSVRYPKLEMLHKADVYNNLLPGNLARIVRILRTGNIELVHVYGQFYDLTFLSVLAAKAMRLPIVLTIGTRMAHARMPYDALFRIADKTLVKHLVARRVDRIIAMDRLMSDYMKNRYGVETAIRFIPAGVDVGRFENASGESVRPRHGLSEQDHVILSMGNLSNFRRLDSLTRALPGVLKEFPRLKILVVGSLYDNSSVELVRRLGLERSVIFCGRVDYDMMPSYLGACDLVANDLDLASWSGMGIGLASLEAMASGKTVVTSATEDNFMDLRLRNWHDIVLVRPSNTCDISLALVRLLSDRRLRESVGRNARRLVREHFSLEALHQKYEAVYEELVNGS